MVLRNKKRNPDDIRGTYAFYQWIRDSLYENKPYDQFVREVLTASGDAAAIRPSPGIARSTRPTSRSKTRPSCSSACGSSVPAATTIRSRNGARTIITASRPSSAASAARHGRRQPTQLREKRLYHNEGVAEADQSADGQDAASRPGLGGKPLDDARRARSAACTGRLDGRARTIRSSPGPGQPVLEALLRPGHRRTRRRHAGDESADESRAVARALAEHFISQRIRPERPGPHDLQVEHVSAQFAAERLQPQGQAELLAVLSEAAQGRSAVRRVPPGDGDVAGLQRPAGRERKPCSFPTRRVGPYFLKVFGQPQADTACECERSQEANLAQSLHLLNSSEVQGKIANAGTAAPRYWPPTNGRPTERSAANCTAGSTPASRTTRR